ncbi:unnamed protein product [Hermetia illucens]|uniref:Chitin-binding type-2 domain-containing protein n=1 Tax=Hermetia illucens TaxID=343691 RepID=A0A7R8YPA1_HERIL|nr:unnamed protein product [Hermetia illucens]
MEVYVILTALLLSGYEITRTTAFTIGGVCDINRAFAANPANSSQFFYCLNNKIQLGSCSGGKIFDLDTAQCVDPGYIGPNCLSNESLTFPYPKNNALYYYCLNRQALVVHCPDGSYYNEYTETCSEGSLGGIDVAVPSCPPGINTLLPDPNGDCQKYVLCINGHASWQTCPNGFYFQPNQQICDTKLPSGCGASCQFKGQLQSIPDNCQAYRYCDGSTWVTIDCPAGYYFSPDRLTCGPIRPSQCSSYDNDDESPCSDESDGVIADPKNCRNYIICLSGVGITISCGPALYFNIEEGACLTDKPTRCT